MPLATLTAGTLRISQHDAEKIAAGEMPQQLFFEIVLARVEVNRNLDEFTPQHLREVAASIAHSPLDDNHQFKIVQGAILDARFDEDEQALIAACVTWPERFPEAAKDLIAGTMRFSIENKAEFVECSTCLSRFSTTTPETAYCRCLQTRFETRATSRRWINNRGIGGAFTKDPAGSECIARDGSLFLVATYAAARSPRQTSQMLCASVFEPQLQKEKDTPMALTAEAVSTLIARLLAAKKAGKSDDDGDETDPELKAAKKSVKAAFDDLSTHVSTTVLAAAKQEAEAALATAKSEAEQAIAATKAAGEQALVTERRMFALSSVKSFPDPEAKRELIASMTPEVWEMTLAGYKLADGAQQVTSPAPAGGAASTAPTAVVPPADPVTAAVVTPPATGAGVLAGSVAAGASSPTPSLPTAGDGGAPKVPTSLREFSWT